MAKLDDAILQQFSADLADALVQDRRLSLEVSAFAAVQIITGLQFGLKSADLPAAVAPFIKGIANKLITLIGSTSTIRDVLLNGFEQDSLPVTVGSAVSAAQ